ncbi:hypothetical protein FHT86_006860 [Rhizobium sp. BK313]|nr:hypothetical protein [Rhizobium sp. BK313]
MFIPVTSHAANARYRPILPIRLDIVDQVHSLLPEEARVHQSQIGCHAGPERCVRIYVTLHMYARRDVDELEIVVDHAEIGASRHNKRDRILDCV